MADRKVPSDTIKRVSDVRSGAMPNKVSDALTASRPTQVERTKIITKDGKLWIVESK